MGLTWPPNLDTGGGRREVGGGKAVGKPKPKPRQAGKLAAPAPSPGRRWSRRRQGDLSIVIESVFIHFHPVTFPRKSACGAHALCDDTRHMLAACSLLPTSRNLHLRAVAALAFRNESARYAIGLGRVKKEHRYLSYLNSHQVKWYHFLHQGKNLCLNPFSHGGPGFK